MYRTAFRPCIWLLLLLPLVPFLGGCDNSIEPFAEEGAFSIYGYLAQDQNVQFIRVKPLNDPLLADSSRRLDATVTLENMTAGNRVTMNDSIVVFGDPPDQVVTHNFWTDAPVQANADYRITVERSDGVTTRATTTTPTDVDPIIAPEEGDCLTTFTVQFRDIEQRPLFASIRFYYDDLFQEVRVLEENGPAENGQVTYQFTPEFILEERIPAPEQPELDFQFAPRCGKLQDDIIEIQYVYVSPDWTGNLPDPDEEFDPTVDQADIENGVGFFGAIRRGSMSITVDTSSIIHTRP